jgi:hypothetical protein
MRLKRDGILPCLLAFLLLTVVGCDKKADEDEPASVTRTETGAVAVDTEKPVSEARSEAGTMSVEDLKAMALKYKEAILAKQDEIGKLAAKVKEIPIAEALGQEAQLLKTDLGDLENALTTLKERFQVYYDALKEKGGDLSGLQP